jgi:hypothetical protein
METTTSPNCSLLVNLKQRALEATDSGELAFIIANETWHLLPYQQALVFLDDFFGRPRLTVISGLVSVIEDTPFTLWARQVCTYLDQRAAATPTARILTAPELPPALQNGWAEWWPETALYQPLLTAHGRQLGAVIYLRDDGWSAADLHLSYLLHRHYAHCLAGFQNPRSNRSQRWRSWRRTALGLTLLGSMTAGAVLIPVRLSVLAPAEIIALQSEVVAAPMDGVIRTCHVLPNQPVSQGQRLFSLDDTTLRNRLDIARETLAVARTDALTAGQKAFDNPQSKSELAALQGQVREKQAEVTYLEELLGRIDVVAAHAGVLIYGDPNDWLGKPVVTGERIAQLAEPEALGVLVWVPVGDAIALQAGAEIRIYLQVSPLHALQAELTQTSYQATLSPEGIASYRIRGRLTATTPVHIGLRGVAKIYGEAQPLLYWMLRRPLGTLRQWVGL